MLSKDALLSRERSWGKRAGATQGLCASHRLESVASSPLVVAVGAFGLGLLVVKPWPSRSVGPPRLLQQLRGCSSAGRMVGPRVDWKAEPSLTSVDQILPFARSEGLLERFVAVAAPCDASDERYDDGR